MSFKSLVNKLMKEGKSKEAATKIAGKVASEKMKGAGSGPTAKQKARMKGSPAKNTGGGRKKVSIDNKETATIKRKSFRRADGSAKLKQKQTSGELGPDEDGMVRKTKKIEKRNPEKKGRRINKTVKIKTKDGVEVRKTKYKGDASKSTTERTSYYRPKGSLKKKAKQRTTTTNVKDKSTSVKMEKSPAKKYDRVVLGGNKGDKSKTKPGKKDYESPAKLKKPPTKKPTKPGKIEGMKDKGKKKPTPRPDGSPAKKPLTGKQKNLPDHLKKAILDAPAKMLSKSGMKMMKDGSPAKMKTPMKKSKKKVEQDYARNAIADYKAGKKKEAKYEKKKALEVAAGEGYFKSPAKMKNPSKKRAKLMNKVEKFDNLSNFRGRPGNLKPRKNEGSEKRYDKRMDRGFDKADKKMSKVMAIDSAAKMKKSPGMMKTNQSGGGYAAKNPAAPAKQLKKLGSVISKHMKSN